MTPISIYSNFARLQLVWGLALMAALAIAAAGIARENWLRTSVFDLLPTARYEPSVAAAAEQISSVAASRLIFLAGHPSPEIAARSATQLADGLRRIAGIAEVEDKLDPDLIRNVGALYFRHHKQLLATSQIEAIQRDNGAALAEQALAAFYSPMGSAGSASLESDPFSLFLGSLSGRTGNLGAFAPRDGRLEARANGITWVLVPVTLARSSFGLREQSELVEAIGEVQAEVEAGDQGVEVLRTGFLFYAHAGAQSAQRDIRLIGTGSLLGILLLIVTTFRSLRPLLLASVSVASGIAWGLAATLSIIGSVHVLTLVFGASLIGVTVDYTFHYVTEEEFGTGRDPADILANILPAITLGCLTSILAYLALGVSPFPGLRQVAVFSAAGLAGAYLAVIALCPVWRARRRTHRRPLVGVISDAWLSMVSLMSRRRRWGLLSLVFIAGVAGLSGLSVDDDIRKLQTRPASLEAEERTIAELVGGIQASSFILVRGDSPDQVLELEEDLRMRLDELADAGRIEGYLAVSRWVPSIRQQDRSAAAYRRLVDARLVPLLEALGMSPERVAAIYDQQMAEPPRPLELEDWISSPASRDLRFLWLGKTDDEYRAAVVVKGSRDAAALEALAHAEERLEYVDQARELSDIFATYRTRIMWALAIAALAATILFAAYLGLARAVSIIVVPVIAAVSAIGLLTLAGLTLTLFNFTALFLVFGVGVDFALFLATRRGSHAAVMLAITLSMLTTMLSFGLLSLSSTQAISGFGLTAAIGIAICYLLAPLAVPGDAPKAAD